MTFFYIGSDNEKDIRRRHESSDHQDPITVTGLTVDGQIKDFTGIVQMIDHDPQRPDGKEWHLIIREISHPPSGQKQVQEAPRAEGDVSHAGTGRQKKHRHVQRIK